MFHRQIVWLQLFYFSFHFEAPAKVRKKEKWRNEFHDHGKKKRSPPRYSAIFFVSWWFLQCFAAAAALSELDRMETHYPLLFNNYRNGSQFKILSLHNRIFSVLLYNNDTAWISSSAFLRDASDKNLKSSSRFQLIASNFHFTRQRGAFTE